MKMKKILTALCLATCVVASGCGESLFYEEESQQQLDTSKTIIYVSNFTAGYGGEWMDKLITRFKELTNDVVLEEGKKGIDVGLNANRQIGTDILTSIATSTDDIFLSEHLSYPSFVAQGRIANIDDVVTSETMGEIFGETKSVLSKMSQTYKDAYQYVDGHYYSIPTYMSTMNLNYNIKLFDEYNLYFAKGGGFITSATAERAAGPDGKEGTSDDGLPATYDDFFTLCAKMKSLNIVPLTFGDGTYLKAFCAQLMADYEGFDNMMLNFTHNGTADHLVKEVNTDGTVVLEDPTNVTAKNGYEVYRQAGRYYSLKFIETLVNNGYIHTSALGGTQGYSYTSAQNDFLMSGISGKREFGMLIDGCWWENEVTSSFNQMTSLYGPQYSRENMKFGVMPLPKATAAQVGEDKTCFALLDANVVVNAKTEGAQLEAAKLFVRFLFSDEAMRLFTETTGVPFILDYDKSGIALNSYGESLSNYVNESNVVLPISTARLYMNNASSLSFWYYNWNTIINNQSYSSLTPILEKQVTAKQYFEGLTDNYKSSWESKFSAYFD